MHIKLIGLNARYTHSCLALFYVRNELEKHCPDAEIEILQGTINDGCYETLLRLTAGQPTAICFSAAIWNSDLVERLIVDLKKILPDCLLIVGGPQAGVIGDRLPLGFCTVVLGEIEAISADFYRDLQQGRLQDRYRGAFFKMPERHLDFPFRDSDFDRHLSNRHIYYESSRGCPVSCTYCLSAAERDVYHKELPQVFAELDRILEHRPQVLRFVDRTFNDNPARALAI
ncbi:MAG: Mg-protoporphyrin IX monomethyl ester oxidative cyclase, partial [Desulfoprunum sp.]|nr:Mg-protoporphyrin IX monomethyl ester oxidative cyclase [Desulfoprunum sp.]